MKKVRSKWTPPKEVVLEDAIVDDNATTVRGA